ncbi:hypothetical protein [Gluconobacter oxydans]|uniref:hypothetical protein n=1 Tax=Gluconobacter oxydans TaxID=442 RepID=UPI001CD8F7AF|nr:hypothetical protein [Gluconobacter oxydans]
MARREWWLSEGAVKTPIRDTGPLRVIWADNHVDAELLQVCKDYCRVEKAWQDAINALGWEEGDEKVNATIGVERDELASRLQKIPAKTEAGLRAKAAAYDVFMNGSWDVMLPEDSPEIERPLLAALIRDLVRKTAGAP